MLLAAAVPPAQQVRTPAVALRMDQAAHVALIQQVLAHELVLVPVQAHVGSDNECCLVHDQRLRPLASNVRLGQLRLRRLQVASHRNAESKRATLPEEQAKREENKARSQNHQSCC